MNAIHISITGHVQAVGFRAFVRKQAELLGLTGWVKNCENGGVEVFAQGDGEKLKILEEQCDNGPANAQVERIIRNEVPEQPLDRFEIRY